MTWNINRRFIAPFLCFFLLVSLYNVYDNKKNVHKVNSQINQSIESFSILKGNSSETQGFIMDSNNEGPLIYIIGGIHGNEEAGPISLETLRTFNLKKGKIYVLPKANVEALAEGVRMKYSVGDLNRKFPGRENTSDVEAMANAIYSHILKQEPDLVIDLHESSYHDEWVAFAYGRSLLFEDVSLLELIEKSVDVLSEISEKPYVYFFGTKEGSLTYALSRDNIPSITFEADSQSSLESRVNEQVGFIRFLLSEKGMLGE